MLKKSRRFLANISLSSRTFFILLILVFLTNITFTIALSHIADLYKKEFYQIISERVLFSTQKLSDKLQETDTANLEQIVSDLSGFDSRDGSVLCILTDGSSILYQSPSITPVEADYYLKLAAMDCHGCFINETHYYLVKTIVPDYNWNCICLISYENLFFDVQKTISTLILIGLAISFITLFLGMLLFSSIGRHLQRLKKKMLLATEDFSSVPPLEEEYTLRHDEIGIMHQQFSKMIEQLNILIQENYVNDLRTKEAQLQAMQSQINPHFLYNTLESINWRAQTAGATDISEMVQSLAALLRVSLRKETRPLTLKQELDLVDNYMKIQHFRFEDRLNYTIEVPDSLWELSIPVLCLQPLAENAIRYGLEDSIDDCEIRIEGYEKNGWVHLIVRNTGSEFEEDQLRQLQQNTHTSQGHGIALLNIFERLRLTFGPKASLCLYNREGWAIAEIIIPEEVNQC